MFQKLLDKFKYYLLSNKEGGDDQLLSDKLESEKIAKRLNFNRANLEEVYASNYDLNIREFSIGRYSIKDAFLIFIEGLVEEKSISENILAPLMNSTEKKVNLEKVANSIISTVKIKEVATIEEVVDGVGTGETALFLEGEQRAILIDTIAFESRSIDKPEVETVVRGPKESFVEDLNVNTSMLRRKLNNRNLKLELITLGEESRTKVCLAYIKGIAKEEIVDEARSRVSQIKIDAILESGYIEEFIVDDPFSIFSTVANTEKPDLVAGKILEGRIAIFVNGTPTVLTVPHIFVESFMMTDDYYTSPYLVFFLRLLRFSSFAVALLLPAIYISVINFHPELLPKELAISVAIASAGVPFPKVLEVLLMAFAFEILREAGVRMPRAVGQAVSIVGALILGDAAINAGLVGSPVVIVTALTAISSFIINPLIEEVTLLRFIAILFATTMGLPGVLTFLIALVIHLSSLRSFGIPYLYPVAPLDLGGWHDIFIRVPWWLMGKRPDLLTKNKRRRVKSGQRPSPYKENDFKKE